MQSSAAIAGILPQCLLERVNDFTEGGDEESGASFESGDVYELLKCPKCDKVSLWVGFWNDAMDPDEFDSSLLYPPEKTKLRGLPVEIQREYDAAQAVKSVSANAFGVLLGRVLDLVCADRGAQGDTLAKRLRDLATKQEIPSKLADMGMVYASSETSAPMQTWGR